MRVKDLTKQYDGKTVVDSVSFEIPKGKVISMIGPNGAGKSTVLNIISRLIARDSGLVDFDGRDIGKWKSKELAKRLAILTQSNNIQMKLTVRELVTFGRFPYSGSHLNEEDQRIIDKAIAYMELEPFQDRFIDELSGGQRQRAYIAIVIAQDTEFILLDEPTNNLDIYHATNMMKIVRRLCDELGKTVILVLHGINYAAFYSDYICAFKDGKEIAKFGTVEEVMTKETLSQNISGGTLESWRSRVAPCPSTIDPAAQTTANIRLEQENTHEKRNLSCTRPGPRTGPDRLLHRWRRHPIHRQPLPRRGEPCGRHRGPLRPRNRHHHLPERRQGVRGAGGPLDPQRIAILDMASLDILDALGVAGGRVVGSADTSLDYLQSYVTDENVANLGTIKTADLEAVMAAQPDVIFIGGRLAKSYDALSAIAPVVYLATDSELGVVEKRPPKRRYHRLHVWPGGQGGRADGRL